MLRAEETLQKTTHIYTLNPIKNKVKKENPKNKFRKDK